MPEGVAPVSSGTDRLSGGLGYDKLFHHSRTESLQISLDGLANDTPDNDNVGLDVEFVEGGNGNDTMIGNDAANRLEGGLGNDTITGRAGNDTLDRDANDDRGPGP